MQLRSVSLSAQLIVTFVVLVAATVAGLTLVAYHSSIRNLESRAADLALTAATTREQLLTQVLRLRLRRVDGFLAVAEQLCGEPYGRGRVAWENGCVRTMLAEFQQTEQATGAALSYAGRRLYTAGQMPEEDEQVLGEWKATLTGDAHRYLTRATRGDAVLTLAFDGRDVEPLIADPTGLGRSGDAFLVDEHGRPLTPRRFGGTQLDAEAVVRKCRSGVPDVDERDYRGQRVFAAYRPVMALRGACMVAYLGYEEALAPAADLRRQLATNGAAFVLAGILLSLIAARRIAAPVRRLAASARALQAGDFSQQVPVDGPTEVQGLGRALSAMASDLAELVSHEQSGRREAEAANRSKDQFLAMLSHELRTPLNAVLGWAHTLRSRPHEADRVQRAAVAIERSAEAQRRLIEDLLDVTGIAAGRVRMDLEPTLVATAVDAALDAVRPRADDKGVAIESTIEDPGLLVQGDSQRLQQVVWNLVWNAVKFTPKGGRVSVRTRAVGALAEITITDTGIGIEPEFLPHVFGWFRREYQEARSTEEGLGLGLALVRQLVELHGGGVRAESAGRNCGSTFVVTLPLLMGESSGLSMAPASNHTRPDSLASIRVLVVDDDAGSREAVRVLLEQVGAQVVTAASAAEARRHLRMSMADVLVSDIAMAQESGYTLMETLRAEGLTLPGIALTGYARREDADRAYAAGFAVHLPKPVDPDVLVSVLVAVSRRVV